MIFKIKKIKKFMCGVSRYVVSRTVAGIIRYLKYRIIRPKTGVILTGADRIVLNFQYPIQFMPSLAIFRELVEPEYQFLRRVLNKDSIFFDVGGGIGTYSLFVAKMVNGPIHTFEPVEENIQTIKINLRVNHVESKVHLNSVALSNQEGFGRIKKDADTTLFSSEITDVSRESFADSINVTTLDSYCAVNKIDHIDLIKIDVEGHEEEVIKGSKNMLKEKNITTIILEADHRLAKFYDSLKDIGFEVFYYDYRNNSIRRIFPICEEAIQNLEPTAFNSNIILIQKKMLDTYAEKFNLLF